ncbi:hypothetical protein ACQP2F_45010 [Actinoplanes sp. CA-030573]|uniref:hypothetical protein n=1 Tax=Actinoplanes sp. CA-030573 TaxID=3239898 RepID=UPI003D8A6B7B
MNSLDASTTADLHPVAMVLADLHHRAVACGLDIMVVGATARDILIRHALGAAPQRATADVDVAVAVSSWAALRQLTGGLAKRSGGEHRFEVRGTEVDRPVVRALLRPEERLGRLAADMGGLIAGNRQLLVAYREGFEAE